MLVMIRVFLFAFNIRIASFQRGDPEHELLQDGCVQLIIDIVFLPALEHQPRLFQHAQVVGDRGAGLGKVAAQLPGGHPPAPQQGEHLPAGRVAEGLEGVPKGHGPFTSISNIF